MSLFSNFLGSLFDSSFGEDGSLKEDIKLQVAHFDDDGIRRIAVDDPSFVIERFIDFRKNRDRHSSVLGDLTNHLTDSVSESVHGFSNRVVSSDDEGDYQDAEIKTGQPSIEEDFVTGVKKQKEDTDSFFVLISKGQPTWGGIVQEIEENAAYGTEESEPQMSSGFHEGGSDGSASDQIDEETWLKTDSIYEPFDCLQFDGAIRLVAGREVNNKSGLSEAVSSDFAGAAEQTVYALETDFGWLPVINYVSLWMLMDETSVDQPSRVSKYIKPVDEIETDPDQLTVQIPTRTSDPEPIDQIRQDDDKQLIYNENQSVEALVDLNRPQVITDRPDFYKNFLKREAQEGMDSQSENLAPIDELIEQ